MENPCKAIDLAENAGELPRGNHVLSIVVNQRTTGVMLDILTKKPRVNLADVVIGARFQFAGDRNWQREVIDVDGEYVHIKTIFTPTGGTDHSFYIIHYSWLRPNPFPKDVEFIPGIGMVGDFIDLGPSQPCVLGTNPDKLIDNGKDEEKV